MTHPKLYFKSILAILVILIMVNPMAAAPVDAYGGYISDNRIQEGEQVVFSATFYNFQDGPVSVVSFNVSFLELLGPSATQDPSKPNISRYLEPGESRFVPSHGSYTDTLTENIDFEPGAYNVSIFFQYSNSSDVNTNTGLLQLYALANQTFAIEGTTQAVEVFRYIGIALGVIIVGAIGLLVYNAKFRKRY